MSNIAALKDATMAGLADAMQTIGDNIARDMKARLEANGHIDTGALRDSIRAETTTEPDKVTTLIFADAQNPENDAYYAEFIELGTGAAHGRPGGRVGTWRYKDRHGNWHTTDGMDADPFIVPSAEANISDIVDQIEYDIAKYARMMQARKGGD